MSDPVSTNVSGDVSDSVSNNVSGDTVSGAVSGGLLPEGKAPLLSVRDLVVEFPVAGGQRVRAVSGVSFDVARGETLGLVGESGCGKSSTAKALALHQAWTGGEVSFDGRDLGALRGDARRRIRTQLQMIWQDPISSLNPRRTVEDQIGDGLRIWNTGTAEERRAKVQQVMEDCGLYYDPGAKRRRHQLSGGQCQRVSIARALVLDPQMLICDEVVSALDVSVQAQILNLLEDMKAKYGLTVLFISHDLAVVRHISDRIVVMYLGKICEIAPADDLYRSPRHHYSVGLLSAVPKIDPEARLQSVPVAVKGDVPSPIRPPAGCRFHTRCPRAEERCTVEEPQLRPIEPGHFVACHFPVEDSRPVELAGSSTGVGVSRVQTDDR